MDDRNKLFRKVHKLLMNEGASHEEARQLVKEELRRGPGGGGGSHPPSHESGNLKCLFKKRLKKEIMRQQKQFHSYKDLRFKIWIHLCSFIFLFDRRKK